MTSPDQSSPSSQVRRLHSFFKIGIVIALSLGAIMLLVDWRTGSQVARPWLQVSFSAIGLLTIGCVLFVSTLSRPRRFLLSGAGLLILLAVIDSLDDHQDMLTMPVILLLSCAGAFAATSIELVEQGIITRRQKVATSIAFLATLTYLGSAGYYLLINLRVAPYDFDHHWLFGFAIVLNMLVRMIGGVTPYVSPMTGNIRICPACGLRNIPERHTCNRCGTRLGSIEHVV